MKRIFIAIVGGTVVLIGIAMIVLPGPAILVIPAGVAILATEFLWARRWIAKGSQVKARWKAARATGLSRWAALKQSFSPLSPDSNSRADTPANRP